jgi:hypothetical protein
MSGKRIVKLATGVYIDPIKVQSVHERDGALGVSMDDGYYYAASDYSTMAELLGAIWPGYVVAG